MASPRSACGWPWARFTVAAVITVIVISGCLEVSISPLGPGGTLVPGPSSRDAIVFPVGPAPLGCDGVDAVWALAPGLAFDANRSRLGVLSYGFRVGEGVPPIDWGKLSNWTERYYGIHVYADQESEVPILFEPTHGSATAPDMDGIAGEVHIQNFSATDTTGHRISWQAYSVDLWTSSDVELTLLHEFGHAFGLAHVLNEGNIMYPTVNDGLLFTPCQRWVLGHVNAAGV